MMLLASTGLKDFTYPKYINLINILLGVFNCADYFDAAQNNAL